MPRAVWLSDLHLDFVAPEEVLACWLAVAAQKPDWVLLGGDIGQACNVVPLLRQAAAVLDVPVAFVLGNHDYYHSSIFQVRAAVREACRQESRLRYLSDAGPIALSDRVALVGHDGWGDARVGDYATSDVVLNDDYLIAELAGIDRDQRRLRLNALGDEAAEHARHVLPQALAGHEEVFFLTHVPPFREACWHDGQLTDDHWAPPLLLPRVRRGTGGGDARLSPPAVDGAVWPYARARGSRHPPQFAGAYRRSHLRAAGHRALIRSGLAPASSFSFLWSRVAWIWHFVQIPAHRESLGLGAAAKVGLGDAVAATANNWHGVCL